MQSLHEAYRTVFGRGDALFELFSPYRICPLGAHVDHQHGLVTGFAFDKGIEFLFSRTDNGDVQMCSLSFEGLTAFSLLKDIENRQGNWGDYIRGAVWAMQKGLTLKYGIRGVVQGSMPIGGLSSSAALLVGCVMALAKVNSLELSKQDIIRYASLAEREYVGLNNGILDQACVALCEKNKLLYLDTDNSSFENIPFGNASCKDELPFEIAIFYSGVTRKLTGTDYNLRVSECKTAAWMIQAYENDPLKELAETCLRDVSEESFLKNRNRMPERFAKRASHFYNECNRVKLGVEAWRNGDIEAFGKCIFESCESSMYQYECGSPELVAIYDIMLTLSGVYGGRFSGAGFKGACIALVDKSKKKGIADRMTEEYLMRYPQYKDTFEVFFCEFSNGAKFL